MARRALVLLSAVLSLTALAVGCSSTDEPDNQGGDEQDFRRHRPTANGAGEALPEERSINGFSIGGFEYWPYKEPQPLYPDKIQWGFEAGSDPARLCMAEATRSLAKILKDGPPPSLLRLKEKHGISSFFNWNNDYTGTEDGIASHRNLWLYNKSLIKWISETNANGSCRIPTRADLDRFATACLDQYPDCY